MKRMSKMVPSFFVHPDINNSIALY